jgi:prefoldin subunit 5
MFTVVQGPNGTGKTPIMKGIMQALGHEVELPPDIVKHCAAAELVLSVDGRPVTLTRKLQKDFDLTVSDGPDVTHFVSQAEYARWFTALFAEGRRTLTNKQHQEADLYATVLLPSLWVDQDHGWTTDYWTPPDRNFILNQRQEVVRFLLGLPARHPFRERTVFDAAKESLERTERTIELQRFVIDRLRTNDQLEDNEEPALQTRRAHLRSEVEANGQAIEAIRSVTTFFDREIAALEAQRDELSAQEAGLSRRKGQLSLVLSELDGEEDILTANVQAADLLRQFCARDGCQMFATSERSFGRSLLFLKDQIKDLKTSDDQLNREAASLARRREALARALDVKRAERLQAVSVSPQAEVLGKLQILTKEVVDVELRVAKVQQYAAERVKFERLLDQREQASAAVAAARPTGSRGVDAVEDARKMLSETMQEWLQTLQTQNTLSARFDDDFTLYVDEAKFSTTTHQSGSTRTRIVLAFHAALLEVSLARGGNHPGWLLLDAPKQHELNQADFDAYAERMQTIAARYPDRVQVVFSVADLKTQLEATDEIWLPSFTIDQKPRFLGPV